jgi:nucleoside-diphosphate-sugar epimerase
MMTTTYFITGGFGFLGQYIVKAIHDHDPEAELRVLVRTQRSTYLHIERLDRIRWISGELNKPETFADQLKGVDTVIHNAALVSYRKSDADAIFQSNVIGTRNLMQAALEAGCRNFIFISSISATEFRPPQITDETMLPNNLEQKRLNDMYGYSKLASEMELKEISGKMRVIILNPSIILGPGSKEIDKAASLVRYLPVIPMLQYINSFVDVRDVARAVVLALTKGRNGERYIVTGSNIGMIEFTQTILRVMGKKATLIPISAGGIKLIDSLLALLKTLRLELGIRRLSEMNIDKPCSSERIQREMGWQPSFSLEQSVRASFEKNTKADH